MLVAGKAVVDFPVRTGIEIEAAAVPWAPPFGVMMEGELIVVDAIASLAPVAVAKLPIQLLLSRVDR
jgi:hypothetical protein